MISDEALMLDFQRGSREAFEELFARYRGAILGFFRRRLDIGERAEDLAQETFLALVRAVSRYEPRAQFRTYLYGIALKSLAKLEGSEREILMLREYEQLSYIEIAEVLRMPLNTVRSRLFRARMALKNHLNPEKKTRSAAAAETQEKDEA